MASSIDTKNSFPKIFISYNHKDQSVAFKIKDKLVRAGLEVIIDAVELGTGGNIPDFIIKSIQKTDITLSLVSTNSLMSSWVAMETLWSNNEETLRGRAFMPCNIDNEFFEVEFTDNVLDAIDIKLEKINKTLKLRLEKNRDFDDLIDDRKRFNQLKVELPLTIFKLKNSLCVNLCDEHFTSGIEKVINDIKKTITKNEGIENERIKNEAEIQNKLIAAQRLKEKQAADENERLEQQKLEAIEAEQKRLRQIEQDKKAEQERLRKQKFPEIQDFMVFVKGGIFTMGSPENEVDRRDNETQHQVKLSDFYICKYAVSVAEFKKFIDDKKYMTDAEKGDGSYVWNGKEWNIEKGINWRFGVSGKERTPAEYDHPVVHVSWYDAVAYCEWLSEQTSKKFRLPTEAEWEFACRAGTSTPFSTGDNLTTEQANFDGNYPYNNNKKGIYRENTVPVNHFQPNVLGLYNMHGNVWEWCNDWYGDYPSSPQTNPKGPSTGADRVLRGGSWFYDGAFCRSVNRYGFTPGSSCYYLGLRVVFVP